MEQWKEIAQEQAELAVFWDEIAQNLPNSVERSALGDEKIFKAFRIAYPKIRQKLNENLLSQKKLELEKACDELKVPLDSEYDLEAFHEGFFKALSDIKSLINETLK